MRRSRRHRGERRRIGRWLIAVLVGACSPDPAPPPVEATTPHPIVVAERPAIEVRGCHAYRGPRCVVRASSKGTATLRLWIDIDASGVVHATADGQPLPLKARPADGGQHVMLRAPEGAETVTVDGVDPRWPEPLVIPLTWTTTHPLVRQAKKRFKKGEQREAIEMLSTALAELEPEPRLAALQALWRMHQGLGETRQSTERAEQAAALARKLGAHRDLAEIASAAVVGAIATQSLRGSQRWLDELERLTEHVSEARAWGPYARGLWLHATGDLMNAATQMAEAERRAERLGMVRQRTAALEQYAVLLGELGRTDEAMAVVRRGMRLADASRLPCDARTSLLGNLGWAQLRLVQQGYPTDVPREALERSLAAAEHECPNPAQAVNQRVNLAIAALVDGELEEAYDRYQQLRAEGVPDWLEPFVAELGAQVALVTGRWEQAPALLTRTPPSGELGLDWSSAVRRADLLSRLGFDDAAIDAYDDAERLLDETSALGSTTIGAERFLSSRSASAWGLVHRLVARGDRAEALCRARMARRRALRRMDRAARIAGLPAPSRERWDRVSIELLETRAELQSQALEDWTLSETQQANRRARRAERRREATVAFEGAMQTLLSEPPSPSCEQLPAVPPGERLLLITSHENESLAFVSDDAGRVQVARLPSTPGYTHWDPDTLTHLADALRGATRIRVMAEGRDRDPALAAVPVGDGTLLDIAPLVHALDLPPRPIGAAEARQALVVADPSEDLPAARSEAEAVDQTLTDAGWKVATHDGRSATRAAIREGLTTAALLHYAGHGAHRGRGGWDAALLLHDGELGVLDLLAVPRVPPAVILAGCDTGSHSAGTWAGGVNLGRAFILAGARQVLAASGTLDDQLALRVGKGLAERIARQPNPDLAEAMQAVQLQLRAEDPDSGWAALHVLVP